MPFDLMLKYYGQFLFDRDDGAGGGAPDDGGDEGAPAAGSDDGAGGAEAKGGDGQGGDEGAGSGDGDGDGDEGAGSGKDDDGGVLGDGDDDGERKVVHADFPEDWKEKYLEKLGGDKKLAKRLERFKHPSDVVTAYAALNQKLSSGEYKRVLPENATEEQLKEYRESEGIPAKPEDYTLPNVKDFEWGEADEQIMGALFPSFHKINASQTQVDEVLQDYAKLASEMADQRKVVDKEFRIASEEELRVEYGTDYRPNMGVFAKAIEDREVFPGELGALLSQARTADGQRLLNHPDFAKFVINMGLDHYGEDGLITGDAKSTVSSRIEEIEKVMKTDIGKYREEGLDKELMELRKRQQGGRKRAA